MSNRFRLGGALAAIAVIVVLGFALIPRPNGSGGPPLPSPSPSLGPSPSPTPSIVSTEGVAVIPPGQLCSSTACQAGTLDRGTYLLDAGSFTPVKFSITLPVGWTADSGGYIRKHSNSAQENLSDLAPNEVFIATFVLTNVFSDACHWQSTMVSAGTTVDQLTTLLVAQKGRVASAPKSVTLGGSPAKRIQFSVPAGLNLASCGNGLLHLWPDPNGTTSGGFCCSVAGSTDVVYVVNVAGQRLVVVTRQAAGASPADVAELSTSVASMKFFIGVPGDSAPSGASPSP